jgi:hypothetical protein
MIRKVGIGQDYKNGMHYELNQPVINKTGDFRISLIKKDSSGGIKIHISNSRNEHMLWKEFNACMPISIEYEVI